MTGLGTAAAAYGYVALAAYAGAAVMDRLVLGQVHWRLNVLVALFWPTSLGLLVYAWARERWR